MSLREITFHHVDVFSPAPFSGNSLPVFPDARSLSAPQMAAITQELRHFEAIFLEPTEDVHTVRARVFDLIEELDFAGHPVIGAACVLHHLLPGAAGTERWSVQLKAKTVEVETNRRGAHFEAELDQGAPVFLRPVGGEFDAAIAEQLGLTPADLDARLRPEVLSTGLRYLLVPLAGADALARARIARDDFDRLLEALGAQFVYVLNAAEMEGRHWNHIGGLEDVATGSGASCVAAYLCKHDRISSGRPVILNQGRFTGRPSRLRLTAIGSGTHIRSVRVGGEVAVVGTGRLTALPQA